MYADIILPVPFRSFTYEVPPELRGQVCRGSRVEVAFGKSKVYAGIVERVHDQAPEGIALRPIRRLLDPEPLVTEAQLRFWGWVADYYMCPLGDVYKAAIPGSLKSPALPRHPKMGEEQASGESLNAPYLAPPPIGGGGGGRGGAALSPAQQTAYEAIIAAWQSGKDITLLHGVTASGKTEIYIRLIADAIARGEQVLYLLPEIALTTQMQERLRKVFGERLGVYHSKFTDRQREMVYRRQLSQQPFDVLLAVRSGIFLPFTRLGLIIVDEEHEPSYKQQEPAPRYHARNAALMLARMGRARVLLGTATPCIETYQRARNGSYGYVPLTTRFRSITLPHVEIVDIARQQFRKRMKGAFSPTLIEAMGETLERKEQIILFQNRRGFAPLLICEQCGWVPHCTRCDVSLTVHKKTRKLVCHYCGNTFPLPPTCPACAEAASLADATATYRPPRLKAAGIGTERVEEQVAVLFPKARTARLDLDTASTRTAFERIIHDFANRESDILIGTQMVAKGLDFSGVSLVGVLDADTLLHVADFRAQERTFHLLAQVAGRAGRAGTPGRVIVQTRTPNSPLIAQMAQDDYLSMFNHQLAERQLFNYPPYARLIFIYLRHRDYDVVEHAATQMATLLKAPFAEQVYGPEPPVIGYIKGMHARKLMVKVPLNASLAAVRQALHQAEQTIRQLPYATNINIFFDVDPM